MSTVHLYERWYVTPCTVKSFKVLEENLWRRLPHSIGIRNYDTYLKLLTRSGSFFSQFSSIAQYRTRSVTKPCTRIPDQ